MPFSLLLAYVTEIISITFQSRPGELARQLTPAGRVNMKMSRAKLAGEGEQKSFFTQTRVA